MYVCMLYRGTGNDIAGYSSFYVCFNFHLHNFLELMILIRSATAMRHVILNEIGYGQFYNWQLAIPKVSLEKYQTSEPLIRVIFCCILIERSQR